MIQTRNLNIDPFWYIKMAGLEKEHAESIGVSKWVTAIRKIFPNLLLGYFNPPLSIMKKVIE
jgi:hypothetical protein